MDDFEKIVEDYTQNKALDHQLKSLRQRIVTNFQSNPVFSENGKSVIHSIRSRLKDPEHLRDKLQRKKDEGRDITLSNYKSEITDLVGVRVLFLFQDQFKTIHNGILDWVEKDGWKMVEPPKAYTWDPEMEKLYKEIGINPQVKESSYTSVHYVIKVDNNNNDICCEIQVRTLFEEAWGEIDHMINYPHPVDSVACREQLKVMAKLVNSGTRLSDSIYRSYAEHIKNNK